MRFYSRIAAGMVLGLLIVGPAGTWAMYKPARVVAPEWVAGIDCINEDICIEDGVDAKKARTLYESALAAVTASVGEFKHNPPLTFCATRRCADDFGLGERTAISVSTLGIILSAKGHKTHYLRHEMIHHRQAEELGTLGQWRSPDSE